MLCSLWVWTWKLKNAVDAEFRLWSFATFSTHTSNQEVYLRLKGEIVYVVEIKFHWTIQTLTEFYHDDPGEKIWHTPSSIKIK